MASYTLTVRDQNGGTERRELGEGVTKIGRKNADILFTDSQVSSRHAEVKFEDGILTFTDVGSSNGSFDKAGRRVTTVTLTQGDTIRFGSCSIEVVELQEPDSNERTSMLTADQIARVLGQAPAPEPVRRAPEPAYEPPPARRAPEPDYEPQMAEP